MRSYAPAISSQRPNHIVRNATMANESWIAIITRVIFTEFCVAFREAQVLEFDVPKNSICLKLTPAKVVRRCGI